MTERRREAIAEYLRGVCGKGARHRIENEVLGKDRVAFNEAREYPYGTRALAATTLDVRDGKRTVSYATITNQRKTI